MGEKMVQFTPRKNINAVRQRKSRLQNRPQLLSVPSKSVRHASVNSLRQETCGRSFREYLFNATLHGLKYMGDGTLTLFERYKTNRCYEKTLYFILSYFYSSIFFGLMFVIVVLLSVYFISNIHTKFTSKPMIISLNARSTDIKSLPFPGKMFKKMYS